MKNMFLRLIAILLTFLMIINPFVPIVHALEDEVQQEEIKQNEENELENEEELENQLEELQEELQEENQEEELQEELEEIEENNQVELLELEEESLEELDENNELENIEEENIEEENIEELDLGVTLEDVEDLKTSIDTEIINIENDKTTISDFINNEKLIGNSPALEDIVSSLEDALLDLNNLKTNANIENYDLTKEELGNIKTNIADLITKFNDENKDLDNSGLLDLITLLNDGYNELDLLRNNYLLNKGYLSSLEIVSLDEELISFYKKLLDLDKKYEEYLKEKELFLKRRPSDKTLLEEKELFLPLYELYKKDNAFIEIERLLNDIWDSLDDVKNYDKLLELELSDELKENILNKRKAYYKVSFIDNPYNIIIRNNKIIIDLMISKDEFISYVVCNGTLDVVEDNGNLTLFVYDYKDELLEELDVVLLEDFNQDGVIDVLDQGLLASEVLKDNPDLFYDLNGDNKVTYDDFLEYEKSDDIREDVDVVWHSYEEDNKMYYKLRMNNGVLSSFYLEINVNNNLKFNSIESLQDYFVSESNNKIIGFNNTSDEIILVYDILDKDDEKSFSVKTTALDILDIYHHVIPKVVINVPVVNEDVIVENTYVDYDYTFENDSIIYDEVEEPSTQKEEDKKEEKEDVQVQEQTKEEEKKENKKITVWNVIKIIVVVLLGAGIVYFLNKREMEKNEGTILEEKKKE